MSIIENYIIPIVVIFLIVYFISRIAQSFIPRLVVFSYGIFYFITDVPISTHILKTPTFYIFLAIILPHITYMLRVLKKLLLDLKYSTINSYYFMLTIYFKTLNLIKAFKAFFNRLIHIFQRKESFFGDDKYSYRYQRQKNKYEEEKAKYYEKSNQNDSYYQEQDFYNRYSSFFDEEESTQTRQDDDKAEYRQFYSQDPFDVLGVSRSDDCKTIKKIYRNLAFKYHPDKNANDKRNTEIFQLINNANEQVKKIKGC